MVSLNLPPAPLRKGNNQALDLHHSIGLSATPSSLWPGRELRKYHYLEVPEAAYSIFKVRSLSEVGRCRDNSVSYFRAKVYGLVVQVTHPLSPCIVYNSTKKQKKSRLKSKTFALPSDGMSFYKISKRDWLEINFKGYTERLRKFQLPPVRQVQALKYPSRPSHGQERFA